MSAPRGITGDAYLHPDVLLSGLREAVVISGVLCLACSSPALAAGSAGGGLEFAR